MNPGHRWARRLGIGLQAVVLGTLLFLALLGLAALTTGATVFRYQGF